MNRPESERYLLLRQRLRVAREVIHEGGNTTDFANRIGVSRVAVTYYLRRNSPATLEALKDGRNKQTLHPLRVLHRLRVIDRHRTKSAAAKELGLTSPGLHMFIARYCPDGVEEALSEYEETYGAPLLEQAA